MKKRKKMMPKGKKMKEEKRGCKFAGERCYQEGGRKARVKIR